MQVKKKEGISTKQARFHEIFSDNMVLQANQDIAIFGECDEQDEIYVSFDQVRQKAQIENGTFRAVFPGQSYGTGHTVTLFSKGNELELQNVAIGEVWLAGGQSNMEYPLSQSISGRLEAALCDGDIRYLSVREDGVENWKCVDEESCHLSAVGYYFAKILAQKLSVPIGIIHVNKGATSVFHWISEEKCLADEVLKPYILTNLSDYKEVSEPFTPRWMGASYPAKYGHFFETCITRLASMKIKGVIWYQGESDAAGEESAQLYKRGFQLLCDQWRDFFHAPDLPFLTTTIANYSGDWTGGKYSKAWAYMREAQAWIGEHFESVYCINGTDCGNEYNIHPIEKETIGKRMAACALAEVYSHPVPYKSPRFQSAVLKQNEVTVHFTDTYSEIMIANGELHGFCIKDGYRVWHEVNGKAFGDTIILDVTGIYKPQYIKYAFHNGCDLRVYNKYGNPLFAFGKKPITKDE